MAASFTIACRNNGFSEADTRAATLESVRAYREAMAAFAEMPTMELWYADLDEDQLMAEIRSAGAGTAKPDKPAAKQDKPGKKQEKAPRRRISGRRRPKGRETGGEGGKRDGRQEKAARTGEKRAEKTRAKAHTRDSLQALSKLGEEVDGRYQIVSQPPIVVPARDLAATYGLSQPQVMSRRGSASSSAPTGPPCKTTGASCWSGSRSWTRPARSSVSAAWAPGVHRPASGPR